MLRNKNLIPLSHQHQHALALCVRIERASPIREADLGVWQSEVAEHFQAEIAIHFNAEEQFLFPAACRFKELTPLVDALLADHAALRGNFKQAASARMSASDLSAFAARLSTHIRREERELFERLQTVMSSEDLALLGKQLDEALKDAAQACVVPAEVRLRSEK